MALHTGTADLRGGDYYGPEVAEYQAALDSARAGMAADDFDGARYDGRTVDLADGIDVALHDT